MARINESFYSTTPVVDEQTKAQAMRAAQPTTSAPAVDTRIALRKLQSGQALTDDEKRSLGLEVTSVTPVTSTITPPPADTPTWVKASTVNTANGPVDVDANGLAADGSTPVAFVANTSGTGVPTGFTSGPFPKELEQFFGSSAGILGYRIINNPDGSQQLEVADGPGSSKTFGFKFGVDNTGKYVKFNSSSGISGSGIGTGLKTSDQIALDAKAESDKAKRKSAYDMLYEEFDRYGLGTLVSDIKNILVDGSLDPTEFSLKIRNTDAYKARFVANEARLAKGLRALSPADYISLEDKYQEVMRQYGLPESYYAKTGTGVQEGFRKLIENDVSNLELEDRISTAQKRVINSNPEVLASLKEFYPDITNSDILAYTLDPKNAIENIKRKVTAAEIGGAATQAGLKAGMTRAEELAAAGITKQQAQTGFRTVAEVTPRGGMLADIYKESPYTQNTAEAEVFGLAGSVEAARQRKKLTQLETAAFQGSAGAGANAIARDRAGVL
jgi:hypothetical protein